VVVLGAGIMAKAALASLAGAGAGVYLVNRTASRAEQVASRAGSHVLSAEFEHLPELLIQSALLVGATASRQPVVGLETVATVLASRAGRPLVILDLAVPRDVDPRVRELPGVSMIDLDDLERLCPLDSAARQAELQRAEVLAAQEADHLVKWVRHRASSPAIVELRAVAETIRAAELRRAARHLKDLTPEQAAAIEALTVGIVNKLLHGPTLTLRDGAARPGGVTRSRRLVQRVLRLGPTRRGRTAHSEN
jgi:glutamyl-tRNA reductase